MNKIKIEKHVAGEWIPTNMRELIKGNIFKMYYSNGMQIGGIHMALNDSIQNSDGMWGIQSTNTTWESAK